MSSPLPSEEKSVEELIAAAMRLCAQVERSVFSLKCTAHLAKYTRANGKSDDAANFRKDYSFILASTREDLENAKQRIIEVKTLLGDEVSSHHEDLENANQRIIEVETLLGDEVSSNLKDIEKVNELILETQLKLYEESTRYTQ
jgi:hypothetical protein